ncbi:MAG TPA: 4Fe-4S dicluster domain-containing protein [Spirochaetes bacterium]|nr:4Fe-4S dicluster domain-containing protein [Spirochaetota bacterium]
MLIKNRRFSGGYRFSKFEGEPGEKIIENPVPQKVIIPLKQGFGKEVVPVVKKGDAVKAGQMIGNDANSVSNPVHSSVNGTVEDIQKMAYPDGEIESVIIHSDGTDGWQALKGQSSDWKKLSDEKIEELIYLSGVAALDSAGIPTRFNSSIVPPKDIKNIIIQAAGDEVYNLSPEVLFEGDRLNQFIYGIRLLRRVMPGAAVHIVLNKYLKKLINKISSLSRDSDWIKIYPLEPKYPQSCNEVVIPTVLKKKYPYGFLPASIGVVVLSAQTALHVYEAVALGKPLIERTIALCGPGFDENLHVKVRVGTPVNDIISPNVKNPEDCRFVTDSTMKGNTITDTGLPIQRTWSKIVALREKKEGEMLSFAKPGFAKDSYSMTFASSFINFKKNADTNIHGEERACISCGFCEQVCPVGIIPHLLFRYTERDLVDEILVIYRIYKCINCNLCTYVCPSKIQVAAYIKEGTEKLLEMGIDYTDPVKQSFELKGLEEYKGLTE